MNRVEKMALDAEEFSTKFMEFMRVVGENPESFVCIFEGEDEKYYSARIQAILNTPLCEHINTGGRTAALELFETIKNHFLYSSYRYLCFIDKDYDDEFDNPDPFRIYSTPGYAVENLYSSLTCLKKVLSAEFNIKAGNELNYLYTRYTQLFKKAHQDFLEAMLEFNVWAKTNYIMHHKGIPTLRMNIKSIKTSNLVDINLENTKQKYDPNQISSIFSNIKFSDLCNDSYKESKLKLSKQDLALNLRGKNCADFMRIYLLAIKTEVATLKFKDGEKPIVRINFSRENFLSEVSQYADTPACLTHFLSQHSKHQIENQDIAR